MIKIEKELKGKIRKDAVLKTLQLNMNFNNKPDEKGNVRVQLPALWFEDSESRESGFENSLSQENFNIFISKENVDIINKICYDALMEQILKGGVEV